MSTTRASPFAPVWRREFGEGFTPTCFFAEPSPVAIKGAFVGTAELKPMIAISPRTRRYG